ncbi:type IV pilus modification protein PilV [Acinetobacter schindleri]
MLMRTRKIQQGVGLIEVLVAMLVLAIGVLGFVALQYRAVEATAESSSRVQAINLARDLAERVRVNRGQAELYIEEISDPDEQLVFSTNCFTANCTPAQLADFDVSQVVSRARSIGMTMNAITCRGNSDGRNCIYVAWNDTSATDGTGTADCTNNTAYNPSSTCLIMELY